MSEETPKADWYPDPDEAGQLRYWDGTTWTAHVAPGAAAQPASDPTANSAQGITPESDTPEIPAQTDAHIAPEIAPTASSEQTSRPKWLLPVAGLVLAAGLAAGLFFAFTSGDEAATGEPLSGDEAWRIDSPFESPPHVVDFTADAVVFTAPEDCGEDCDQNRIAVIDPSNGNVLWQELFEGDRPYRPGGLRTWALDNVLIVAPSSLGDADLRAFDLITGEELWQTAVGETWLPNLFRPFGDMVVVQAPERQGLLALDVKTGQERWAVDLEGNQVLNIETVGTETIVLRRIIRDDERGPQFALEGWDLQGTQVWAAPSEFAFGPNVARNDQTASAVRVARDEAAVRAYDITTGETVWDYPLPGLNEPESVVVTDYATGRVVISVVERNDITLTAIDLATGDDLWRNQLTLESQAEFGGRPTVVSWTDTVALVGDTEVRITGGPLRVVALDLADGTQRWDTTIGDQEATINIAPMLDGFKIRPAADPARTHYIVSIGRLRTERLDLETGGIFEVVGERAALAAIDERQRVRIERTDTSTSVEVVGTDSLIELGSDGLPISHVGGVLYVATDDEIVAVE